MAKNLESRRKVVTFQPCIDTESTDIIFSPMLIAMTIDVIHGEEVTMRLTTTGTPMTIVIQDFLSQSLAGEAIERESFSTGGWELSSNKPFGSKTFRTQRFAR